MGVTMMVKKLSVEEAKTLRQNPELIKQNIYGPSGRNHSQPEPSPEYINAYQKYLNLTGTPDKSLFRTLFGMKQKDVLPEPWPDEHESVTAMRKDYQDQGKTGPKWAALLEMAYYQKMEEVTQPVESADEYSIWSDPEVLDLDKSYYALHFLLTGRTEDDFQESNSEGFMIADLLNPDCYELEWLGEDESGGGWLNPEQVKEMDVFLCELSEDDLRKHFNPEEMDAKAVPPGAWVTEGEEGFQYCLPYFQEYQKFVKSAAEGGVGLWHLMMV